MNEQHIKEAIDLLHEARRLLHNHLNLGAHHEAVLIFLANSESFLADALNEKPRYEL